jgi:hypothetical protein
MSMSRMFSTYDDAFEFGFGFELTRADSSRPSVFVGTLRETASTSLNHVHRHGLRTTLRAHRERR